MIRNAGTEQQMHKNMSEEFRQLAEHLATFDPDMASIVQEMSRLDSQGRLDESMAETFQLRIQALIDKRKRDENAQITSLQTRPEAPQARPLPNPYAFIALATLLFVVSGSLLEATVGQQFIFSESNSYWLAMPWLLGILIPLFAWMFFQIERKQHVMSNRYPTRAIRLIIFPLVVVMSAAMVLAAPLGWVALAGWASGTTTDNLAASVVRIRPPSHSTRGCDQKAEIRFRSVSASICVDGRIAGIQPGNGDNVVVRGRLSSLGLYIEQIRKE